MRIRLLEINLDKKNYYKNKIITITSGYNVPHFKPDERVSAPLEVAERFYATDGEQTYELLDVRKKFVDVIKSKQLGEIQVNLGITRHRHEANCYIHKLEVLEY